LGDACGILFYRPQNEQARVHFAAAYAKRKNRFQTSPHVVDRPGRDEHGHRRGRRRQPPAGPAAAE
jgi:hypothetical protein